MSQVDTDRLQSAEKAHFHWADTASTVGQWELVEKAAEGRLAEIYLARPAGSDHATSPPYAVKILRRQWETDPRAVATIRREALAGRLVSHPHLISILSGSTSSPPYYVVMPWLTGGTLAARLAGGKAVETSESLWIARQIADALGALEGAGWMHGDVKPSNIFLSPEGHATLLDLGFARRTDRSQETVERCLAGTGHYMAPEAFSAKLGADIRSDLYSLGVTMFEMLCGEPPFTGSSAAELAREHREARPARLEEVVGRLPPDAGLLLRQMLAKQPIRRPQTAREVVERLVRAEIATLANRVRC